MISKFSVRKPYTVIVALVLIIILGVVSTTKMTADLFPSMNLPYVLVMTTYPGATPEEVEETVTKPVEQSMATVSNVKNVFSQSSENVSVVYMEFESDTDMKSVTLDMRENLDMIKGNWDDAIGNPTIMKMNPSMMPVLVTAVDIDGKKRSEVSETVENEIVPEIESVEGVASVTTSGILEQSIQVMVQQDKVDAMNKKIKKALDSKFADADDKIKDAKNKLDSGKTELDSQKTKAYEQLAKASSQISDGKLKLLKTEIELNSTLATIKSQQTELKTTLTKLQGQLKAAEDGVKSLQQVKTNYESLVGSKTKLEQQKAVIESNSALSKEQKAAMLTPINAALTQVKQGIQTIEGALSKQNMKPSDLGKKIKEAQNGVTQLKKAIKDVQAGQTKLAKARKQVEAGLKKINKGQSSVSEQETKLNVSSAQTQDKLNDAQNQMTNGKNQIDSQETTMKDAKKTTYENTDLENILTSEMLGGMLTAQNFSMPAGYITDDNTKYMVRVGDKFENKEDMADMVILDLGLDDLDPIKLSDVADVAMVDNSSEIYTKVNQNDGVALSIMRQTNYATAQVSDNINKKLKSLEKEYDNLHTTNVMDQGIYIDLVVDSVVDNMIYGGLLAILILLVFLRDLKPTAIIAVSIPVSVVFTLVLMYFSGVTLNVISLSGLALGIGMLVDNSIVVIENIYRLRNEGVPAKEAAVQGAKEVTGAIIASTLTTVSVFLPIVFTTGITKQLFTDMALTIAYSLLASLMIAITFVPMASSGLLRKQKEKEHKILNKIHDIYDVTIRVVLHHRIIVLLLAVILFVSSIFLAVANGTSLMPSMESPQMSATLSLPHGTKLEQTSEMSEKIIAELKKDSDVDTVLATLSSGSMMSMSSDTNAVQFYIMLKEDKKKTNAEIAEAFEKKLTSYVESKDGEFKVTESMMDMSALSASGVVVNVKGQDMEKMQKAAQELGAKLEKVKGIEEVDNGLQETDDELRLVVNKDKAAKYGLTVAQIYQAVAGKVKDPTAATKVSIDSKDYSVYVKFDKDQEINQQDLEDTKVTGKKDGKDKKVKIGSLVESTKDKSLSSISRTNQVRQITVSGTIKDTYNVGLVSKDAKKALKSYDAPKGIDVEFSGEDEDVMEAMGQVLLMLALALAFMYLIMVAQFQSLLSPFIIMFTIPLAFTGGFLALLLTGQDVSVIAMIGFVMLSGIIVNNGIVLVDCINRLRIDEGMSKHDAIVEAGKMRLRPIIMTALTTILGLSTMALGIGMGSSMVQPMAIVTIGGLIYGTLLTLYVVPCIYDLIGKRKM